MTKLNKALMASTAIAFASGLAIPASAQDPKHQASFTVRRKLRSSSTARLPVRSVSSATAIR